MIRLLLVLCLGAATLHAQTEADYGTTHRIKLDVGGEGRKAAFFVPKGLRKNEALPLLVAIPDTRGKAYLELGQWQQPAWQKRFAVLSVDIKTSGVQGWHPSEQLEMQRDMDAVIEALAKAKELAKETNVEIDESAIVITGHSGGTYLTLWLGLRRPDLFLGICGRSCVFHKETIKFGKLDTVPPDFDMPIFLYRGEVDHPRTSKQTEEAANVLRKAGWKNVKYEVVSKMAHESKPEVCLGWFSRLLRETAKERAARRRIAEEVDELRDDLQEGRSGAISKLSKLVDKEKRAGIEGEATKLLAGVLDKARELWAEAENLEADHHLIEAAATYRKLDRKYSPLPISKDARKKRSGIIRSDAYKAEEMLVKARGYIDEGKSDKARPILERILEKYPGTVAAGRAEHLLQSSG
jgi:predicted esterase